jgi:predicted GIY-YIG superfamily endonuclease
MRNVLCLYARKPTARDPLSRVDLGPRPVSWEHKVKAVPEFTAKYGVNRLVWFEPHESLEAAMLREKRVKSWRRAWKIELIETDNPHVIDLFPTISR